MGHRELAHLSDEERAQRLAGLVKFDERAAARRQKASKRFQIVVMGVYCAIFAAVVIATKIMFG